MFTKDDIQLLSKKGISEQQIEQQLADFRKGFPFLKLDSAASIGNGILAPQENERHGFVKVWEKYKADGHKIVKFVPASGAASRMFKNMFAFIDADYDEPTTDFEKQYFDNIAKFAFFDALNELGNVDAMIKEGRYKDVDRNMLDGLGYGKLPKGMLLFHKYDEGARTPMEEHLVEGALYAESKGEVNLHFTVSAEHLDFFKKKVEEKEAFYADKFDVKFNISFSVQKPSTDTVAATLDNDLFRDENNQLVFRPGGHGALIENLNDIDADVVFIKNIDNVVPDRLKGETVTYKNLLAGILVDIQSKTFEYLEILESGDYNHEQLVEMLAFLENHLYCRSSEAYAYDDAKLAEYLYRKFNRPMRVCGVVKNVGEPGGGPFLAYNQDGTVSLQILESSQIDKANEEYMKMFTEGTHFNPVDLVCAIKDYKGRKFNLPEYVDKTTGFISSKSKGGKELRALELPGLWNGAMSDWNTVFVEVPLITFNPVKTVNDLLRPEHQ